MEMDLRKINIKELAFDQNRYGPLVFSEAAPMLEHLQKIFIEFDDLVSTEHLTSQQIIEIKGLRKEYLKILEELASFDMKTAENPSQFHQRLTRAVDALNNSVGSRIIPFLTYSRQENEKNIDKVELEQRKKDAIKAKKEYDSMTEQMMLHKKVVESKLKELEGRHEQVSSAHGQIAATELSHLFSDEAEFHVNEARSWQQKRKRMILFTEFAIFFNVTIYIILLFSHEISETRMSPEEFFTPTYGLLKLAAFSVASYIVAFSTRNYKIHMNLAMMNRHRRNVGQTLNDYLGTNPTPEDRGVMVRQGAEALFKHLPQGYITKIEQTSDRSPLNDVINTIVNK